MNNTEKSREYRKRTRKFLIVELGGKCVLCGDGNWSVLEFDHIFGRDYDVRELSSGARIARYKRECQEGLIRLLCSKCNLKERVRMENGGFVKTGSLVKVTIAMPF